MSKITSLNEDCLTALKATGIYHGGSAVDVLHDVFSFSLINSQGQFIMDSSGEFGITRPYSQTKITVHESAGYITGIDMVDESGNTFNFLGPTHYGINLSSNSCFNDIANEQDFIIPNYKIEKIKSPKNKEINFTYGKTIKSKSITSIVEQELIDYEGFFGSSPNNYEPVIQEKCLNYTYSEESVLTQISFEGGTVYFYYNNDTEGFTESLRQDLYLDEEISDVYLTRVIVKSSSDQVIKDISLHYIYWTSVDSLPDDIDVDFTNNVRKRLVLDKVIDNLVSSEYKFSYYNEYSLPNRLSNSQDYWGVFNGQSNSETSIPTVKTAGYGNQQHIDVYFGANKEPNILYGVLGNLKKIEYPTGGYTEITYEADNYLKEIYVPAVFEYEPQYPDVFVNELDPVTYFTIPANAYHKRLHFYGTQHENGNTQTGDCFWRLSLFNGLQYDEVATETSTTNEEGLKRYDSAGNYKLEIVPAETPTGDCYVSYNWWNEIIVNDADTRNTGTLRIKKLEYNTADNGKITREYVYEYPEDYEIEELRNKSSGKNLGEELFSALNTRLKTMGPRSDTYGSLGYVHELIRSNNPGWQTNTVRGKSVGYSFVQEIFTSDSANYKKEYIFKNGENNSWAQYNPLTPTQFSFPLSDLNNGFLLEEILYNEEGLSVRSTKNDPPVHDGYFNQPPFSTMIPNTQYNFELALVMDIVIKRISTDPYDIHPNYQFETTIYPIENYWIKNVKVTTTEYDSNENPTIVITDNMEYSPDYKHTFLSAKITENSLGETIRTEYYYPEDLTAYYEQSSMMNKLVERNMIASPVITKTFVDQTPVAEQRTHYFHFHENDPSGGFILPQYVFARKGEIGATSSAEDKKITYDRYDEKGNLTEYTLADGTPVSIIWGYNGQYPIAKVEGVRNNQITNHILTLESLSNSGTLVPGSFESLRNFTGALVTCYIYEPLVGVTTIIQANGQREFYEYDGAGRLMHVKDHNGNVLKQIEYHYKE